MHYLTWSYDFAGELFSVFIRLLIIARQVVIVDRNIIKIFIVSKSYDNRQMFCKLDVRHKSIVGPNFFALS